MTQIAYDLDNDFPDGINKDYFEYEIRTTFKQNIEIKFTISRVRLNFENVLTTDELNQLHSMVLNHNPDNFFGDYNVVHLPLVIKEIDTYVYCRIAEIFFDVSFNRNINKIIISSYKDPNIISYDIRLFDRTNIKILKEFTLSNDSEENNLIKDFTNVPFTDSFFEIHVKKNGGEDGDLVHINKIDLYLEK